MKYLLDTDHLSVLQKSTGRDYEYLSARMAQIPISDFAISIVTVHEQFLGSHTYISRTRNVRDLVKGYEFMTRLVGNIKIIPVAPFDDSASILFENFQAQGVKVATMDLRIAAIACSRGSILLTRNHRDFVKVPGLKIEDWTQEI
jgi:tRNA(fMet)-specific endonuclease VapC